ncbi:MAG TPA: 1-deoxy-D-xylulose-5-phosphate reductoisomerase [Thermomicrobiales bacterium]|nr:1-deoxy-D-xylulose-5-phosphate reductoisomerase [Thermomicrobiales bacterium]
MISPVPLLDTSSAAPTTADPIGISILGSTGSVGRQALDVISRMPDRFRIVALAAGANSELLAEQAARFRPSLVALHAASTSSTALPTINGEWIAGADGLLAVATHPDASIVIVATSGHAAIEPTLAAIRAGKTIALANKETIVCAGELVTSLAFEHKVQIRPVDSEHSALWQSLVGARREDIAKLILTASGGPFRELSAGSLSTVTATAALSHPTWRMGQKITIDSATLMNKGLEVIEAHWLFGVPFSDIDVVVHPQSIIHSLVAFADGSQIAQLSLPDMRLPIQFALTFPNHEASPCQPLSLADIGTLTFEPPDESRFPALRLARSAGARGGTYPTVLSAADDVAVEAFMQGLISFLDVSSIIESVLAAHEGSGGLSLDAILEADRWGRARAGELVRARSGSTPTASHGPA